jgi:hypothetical protein
MLILFFISFFSLQTNQINSYDGSGYTPLILSIINKDYKKTEELIKSGADINLGRNTDKIYYSINPESNKTPLMYAVTLNNMPVIKLLVKKGVDINKKNKMGVTALLFGIDSKNHDIVYYLYDKIKNKRDPKILAQAIKVGDLELTNFFLKNKIPLTYESRKDNLLTLAIKSKNIEIVKEILKQDESFLNKQTKDGEYPIMVAITTGNYTIFNELLKYKKLQITIKNKRNQTLLHIATQRFETDAIIKKLLDMNIDANIIDIFGKTALFYLIKRQNNSVIKYLIDKTDLSIKDNENRTVYFDAVDNYNLFNIMMIKRKTTITSKDKSGKSLLLYIIDRGDYRVLKLFEKDLKENINSFKNQNILSVAVRRGNYDMVNILLKAGFNVNGDSRNQIPPLLKAAELNKVDILYLLLFHNANKNAYYEGRTAWSIAEQFNYKRILFLLRNFEFPKNN